MTTKTKSLTASNEAAIDLITTMQEQILEATKTYVSALSDSSPETLGWTAPDPVEQPDPKELIEETFKFQSRLLEANKSFALSLTETWGSLEQPGTKE
jgi:hypothetical protein